MIIIQENKKLPKEIEVVICSYGGVGTTSFMYFIKNFKKINHPDNIGGLKHLPIPPKSSNKYLKYIYIYGDPRLAAISLLKEDGTKHNL